MSGAGNHRPSALDRRRLLQAGAAAAFAGPLGALGAQALSLRTAPPIDFSEFPICRTASEAPALTGAPRKLRLSWNAGAVCLAPVPVAIDNGFFQKQNLDVELVNYSGSTDQLLEAIATGKSDAGLGMALRWLKPLEQGFDVKIAAGTHGGCMRVLTRTDSGVNQLAGRECFSRAHGFLPSTTARFANAWLRAFFSEGSRTSSMPFAASFSPSFVGAASCSAAAILAARQIRSTR